MYSHSRGWRWDETDKEYGSSDNSDYENNLYEV
jgi:hypothetical protein